jgi:ornithine cyclodeaminase
LILNDHEYCHPFACLEAPIISAARTAASAALAAEQLTSLGRRAHTLTIVGAGLIARYIYRFLMGTGWRIDNVLLYDILPREAESFAANACDPGLLSSVACCPRCEPAT